MIRILAFLLAFCVGPCTVLAQGQVRIFAAASLREAIEEIASGASTEVQLSFGGSGTMARQAASGAPADLVILANALWTQWLLEKGIASGDEVRVIARNTLVLVAAAGTPALQNASQLPDRLGQDRLAMGQRDAVPAGIYARQWLQAADIWPALRDRLAETDNVRAALALVARGQASFGVVYATDTAAEPRVARVLDIAASTHDAIEYTAVPLTPKGAAFAATLVQPAAQSVFASHGFQPVQP